MTPVVALERPPWMTPELQMKVPVASYARKIPLIVAEPGNHVATRHRLPFLDEDSLHMAVECHQGLGFHVLAVVDEDGGTKALLDIGLYHAAVCDGDDRLTGRPSNIDPLVYHVPAHHVPALATGPPAVKVGHDPRRKADALRIRHDTVAAALPGRRYTEREHHYHAERCYRILPFHGSLRPLVHTVARGQAL